MTVLKVRGAKGSIRMSPRTRARRTAPLATLATFGELGQSAARAIEHRRGAIDADQTDAGPCERQRDPSRAASELEHRAVGLERDAAPERHVAPAERPRVLPVVERRVVVPAFPAFSAGLCPDSGTWLETGSRALFDRAPRAPESSCLRDTGLVRHGDFARHDRTRARQFAEAGEVADEREDARRNTSSLIESPTRRRGSTFHISHNAGCAQQTAHTDP